MPNKKDPYASAAQKVLGLYGLLLFTGRKYSLPQLAELFQCSKQTVLRMIEQIERTHRIQIDAWMEDGKKWYRARTPRQRPNVTLSVEAIQHLLLCRDIVWHLLPEALRDSISETIEKTAVLLPEYEEREDALTTFARSQPKGTVDYSKAQHIITALLRAMRERRICEITYHSPENPKPTTLTVAPYRFIAFREGLYAKCRMEKALAEPDKFFDPTLAVHRISELILTDRRFKPITDTGGETEGAFGLGTEKPFRVVVDIIPKAAMYVRERVWSKDQVITPHKDGSLTLEFSATSKQEVLAWVLSFGGEATLREPIDTRKEVVLRLRAMYATHSQDGDLETCGATYGVTKC